MHNLRSRGTSFATLAMTGTMLVMMSASLGAQTTPTAPPATSSKADNPVLSRIQTLGMDSTQTYELAQTLMDSLGPRLTGTPQQLAAMDWVVRQYASWGISARKDEYARGRGWDRGWTHIDLVEPRMRTLDGMMLAWSPGTNGQWVQGEVIVPPRSDDDLNAWITNAKGKYVLQGNPQPTCRPFEDVKKWSKYGAPIPQLDRVPPFGSDLLSRMDLDSIGIAGILKNEWSQGWGVDKIFSAVTKNVPSLHLSCEDYGLVARMALRNQKPVIRVNAQSTMTPDVPYFNVIGEIKGTEFPDEYVVLSAHFDSWDGATGATDNGTGTVIMMEAMRILKAAYPKPKRTILVGHWNGEEQGLFGSKGFVSKFPDIVKGVRTVLNQDSGTGELEAIIGKGITTEMVSQLPESLTKDVKLRLGASPTSASSDHASFARAGAPASVLASAPWNYGSYTWHTNRDTFDKISIENLKRNATITAMLAYLVSEQSEPRSASKK